MDTFLLKSFTQSLIEIYSDSTTPIKMQLFILTIWKKATSNIHLMTSHLKYARAIALAVLRQPARVLQSQQCASTKDINRYRFKILQHLSSDNIRLFTTFDIDNYQLALLIVDNLNEYPCNPSELKHIMDIFKISNLNIRRNEFVLLSNNAKSNSAFNFLWVAFWIGAEVNLS